MGSERAEDDHRSRRRDDYRDDLRDGTSSSRHNKRDPAEDSQRHRRRSRDRSRDRSRSPRRDQRRRSRSPDSKRRRSRSRSPRDRARERDGDRERRRERDRYRDRGGDDSDRRHRRRDDKDKDKDGYSDRDRDRERDRDRDRRRNRSSERHSSRRGTQQPDDSKPDSDMADNKRSLIKRNGPLPSQGDSFAVSTGEEPEKPKEKPNFGNTGVLAAQSNTVTQADGTTVTLKYHEPPEARKPAPRDQWRLYVFKGDEVIDTIELHTRSCWLVGRDMAIADLPAEHPSISKQHAVIQFRYTEKRNEYGDKIGRVKPYLIDLESANGTKLNGDKVPDSRYLELRDKDMIQFGSSTREYVLMLPPKD
ncbi:SMAD/FHA domain-containing protein [Sordaria brevicollis]|uniref:SMAD/FHA domain-containing protein n=1 Tax=Sordaria brevicollis TaxID=83679 RepID=A0AAE0U2V4_SORBR|nr:SMAD/FHA domain-containing protein [Sordaria brevicollis]